jgi:hypothetical protein
MRKRMPKWGGIGLVLVLLLVPLLVACQGSTGETGPAGKQGPPGPPGPAGESATTPTFAIKFDPGEPGCGGACHEALASHIDPNPEGKYTLAYEANHAWAGHNFDPLGELKTLSDCLECHAVGAGDRAGMGNVSSKSLRDIVHRVHLTSPHFTVELAGEEEERQGDCFTCHEVSGPSTTGL